MAADGRIEIDTRINNSGATRGINELRQSLNSAGEKVKGLGSSLGSSLVSHITAVTGAVSVMGAAMAGIKYDAMMEQSQTAWTTLLGSTKEAKNMLQDISNFAKSTPFETADVDMMAKYMHNAGLEGKGLWDALMKVSDVSSAFNIPIAEAKEMTRQMSQVRQAGVAYTEDLNILQDRGVPIYKAIAKELHTNVAVVKQLASNGKITSDIYIKAFNGIADSVKGASDKQSQTMNGMLSTLSDNLKIISGELMKGAFEKLKEVMNSFMPILDKFSSTLKDKGLKAALTELFGGEVVDKAQKIFNTIKDVGIAAFNGLKEAVKFCYDNFNLLAPILAGVLAAIKSYQIMSSINKLWIAWKESTIAATLAEEGLNAALLANPIGLVAAAIGLLVAAGVALYMNWDKVKGFLSSIWDWMKVAASTIFGGLASFFKKWGLDILIFLSGPIGILAKLIYDHWDQIKAKTSAAWNSIKSFLSSLWNSLKGIAAAAWNGIKSAISAALNLAKNAITAEINGWKKVFDIGKQLVTIGKNIIQGLINGIKSKVSDVINSVKSIADGISGTVKKVLGIHSPSIVMQKNGEYIVTGLDNGIKKSKPKVVKTVKNMSSQIAKEFNTDLNQIKLKLSAGKISSKEAISELNKLKSEYKKVPLAADKVNAQINAIEKSSTAKSKAEYKARFEAEKKALADKVSQNSISLTQELKEDEKYQRAYKKGTDERSYWDSQVLATKKKINDQLTSINNDYLAKAQEVNKKLADDTKALNDAYEQAVTERANSLYSFAGIFDEVQKKTDVTGQNLMNNLQSQVDTLQTWTDNLGSLTKKGLDKGLLAELQNLGPAAADEIAALNTMSGPELTKYTILWQQKHALARSEATNELTGLNDDTKNKIQELQKTAATELTNLKNQWSAQIKAISTVTKTNLSVMPSIGKSAIDGLISGMQSMTGPLKKQADEIAATIKNTIKKALDIHSPSRVMRDQVGKWIPAGLAEGINANVGLVTNSVNTMTQKVIPISTKNLGINTNATSAIKQPSLGSNQVAIENVIVMDSVEIARGTKQHIDTMMSTDYKVYSFMKGVKQ